ncbi:hypothetical protein HKD21_13655 [Gluconobacter cerevisiae]|uniref:Rap1a immunity protein domain-containing protein n=1 Tax=Gluconobacter cerevisiae TaxID=1379734 RepID=A0ABR9YHQ6_9PROT|nr:hypothetical protein [Gluconobacter cerevisiae]MBF0877877.1 hypothetical protein [Gluconobacter cerevisiae]
MKKNLLLICGIFLIPSGAYAANGPLPSMSLDGCTMFLSAFEKNKNIIAKYKSSLGPFNSVSDVEYGEYAGYLEGLMAGYNLYGSKPIWNTAIGNDSALLRMVYNYCSSHPDAYLKNATDAIIEQLGNHPNIPN